MSSTSPAPQPLARQEPLLQVRDLTVAFVGRGTTVRAVNGISFDIAPGEALGMVGESGSGKSVSASALLGLLGRNARVTAGSAQFEGRDLLRLRSRELREIRGRRIGIVFQDPLSSLNPVLRIGMQIEEVLEAHGKGNAATRASRAVELLQLVGIPEPRQIAFAYPHQLSGGMRQRAMIAAAISCEPALLIADEPTTALDVTIQAQILEHLRSLRERLGMAILLITHDLAVVAGTTDRIVVMYAGRIVETGPTRDILAHPFHPYTEGLLRSIPQLDRPRMRRLASIEGSPPDSSRPTEGCSFKLRCSKRMAQCDVSPFLRHLRRADHGENRAVACWLVTEDNQPTSPKPKQ